MYFTKKKFKIKGALWEINQAALMFVMTAVAIPRFIIIVKLGIYNTMACTYFAFDCNAGRFVLS